MLRERCTQIRVMLVKNLLTQTWLINQLEKVGIYADKTEISSILRGIRRGPKAENIISKSLEILKSYEEKMNT